jgi:hypothetical protein
MKKQHVVKENQCFTMFEVSVPGKTVYRIFKHGACALEEVKTLRGGGHTTKRAALNEFDRLTCVQVYKTKGLEVDLRK